MMEQRKYRTGYEYEMGSAARKLQPVEHIEHGPRLVEQPQVEQKLGVGLGIDAISMVLLMGAIVATLVVCVNYLKVQAEIVQLNKAIVSLEKQISDVEKENNALSANMDTEMYDLEYVYDIAVGVLGMVYPNNNEVIYYDNESDGYFRQYQDIPE